MAKSKKPLKKGVNFKNPFFLFLVAAFVVAGGIAIIKSYAATGTVNFTLPAQTVRYVPQSGSEYSNHWYFSCGSGPGNYSVVINSPKSTVFQKTVVLGNAVVANIPANNNQAAVGNLSFHQVSCTVYWSVK